MPSKESITRSVQIFQIARYGIWFGLSVWLARLDPSKVIVSQYETLVLISGSLSFFWLSGIFDTLVPLWRKSAQSLQPFLIGSALRWGISLAAVVGFLTWLLSAYLHPEFGNSTILFFCAYIFFHLGSATLEHVWILRGRSTTLMLGGSIYFLILSLELGLPLAIGRSLEDAFALMAAWSGLRFVVQAILLRRELLAFGPRPTGSGLMAAALPMALASLLGGGATYFDSNLVRYSFSQDDFVNFTYGARELPLALLLANALSLVKSGEIAAARTSEDRLLALHSLRRSASRTMHMVFPIAILLILFSRPLVIAVLGASYEDAHIILDISLLLVIPRMVFPQAVVKAHLRGWALTWVSLAELALNVVLSIWLMQYWGTAGVAAGTVIAYAAEKLFLALYAKRKLGYAFGIYTPVPLWLGYSLLLVLAFILKPFISL